MELSQEKFIWIEILQNSFNPKRHFILTLSMRSSITSTHSRVLRCLQVAAIKQAILKKKRLYLLSYIIPKYLSFCTNTPLININIDACTVSIFCLKFTPVSPGYVVETVTEVYSVHTFFLNLNH